MQNIFPKDHYTLNILCDDMEHVDGAITKPTGIYPAPEGKMLRDYVHVKDKFWTDTSPIGKQLLTRHQGVFCGTGGKPGRQARNVQGA
jgi:hypothetical protein